jgi:hypothetical protein
MKKRFLTKAIVAFAQRLEHLSEDDDVAMLDAAWPTRPTLRPRYSH